MWFVAMDNKGKTIIVSDDIVKMPLAGKNEKSYPGNQKVKDVVEEYLKEYSPSPNVLVIVDTYQKYMSFRVSNFLNALAKEHKSMQKAESGNEELDGLEERFNEVQNGLF